MLKIRPVGGKDAQLGHRAQPFALYPLLFRPMPYAVSQARDRAGSSLPVGFLTRPAAEFCH
jgi:hypothetical protein